MSNSTSDASSYCSFCKTLTVPYINSRDYNRGVSESPYRYHRCPKCSVVTLINVPEDIGHYYAYDYHAVPTDLAYIERRATHEQYKIELVKQFVDRGNLLEIGPSWGAFCLLAKRAGFSVEAIERDLECCEFLRSKIQVRAILSEQEATALDQTHTPNVIALWHVIEHMRDPRTLLKRAAEHLAPGGTLIIATPSPQALQFRLFGRYWAHLDAPRHINLIPAQVLCDQMKEFGLNTLMCTTNDPGSIECNVFGWRKSLSNLVSDSFLKHQVYYWGRLVADIAGLIERRGRNGSAYTAVFIKPLKANDTQSSSLSNDA